MVLDNCEHVLPAAADVAEAVRSWQEDGLAILPSYLSSVDLLPALVEMSTVFPGPDEFHDDVEPDRNRSFREEFGGITDFPFTSTALSLLAVHHSLIDLAEGHRGA